MAWHDDRLWRNVIEQQVLFEMFRERGVRQIIAGGREYDTSSADDNVPSGVQALFAQKEPADKSRRIRRKALQLAQEGKLNGRGGKGHLSSNSRGRNSALDVGCGSGHLGGGARANLQASGWGRYIGRHARPREAISAADGRFSPRSQSAPAASVFGDNGSPLQVVPTQA